MYYPQIVFNVPFVLISIDKYELFNTKPIHSIGNLTIKSHYKCTYTKTIHTKGDFTVKAHYKHAHDIFIYI